VIGGRKDGVDGKGSKINWDPSSVWPRGIVSPGHDLSQIMQQGYGLGLNQRETEQGH